MSGVRNSSNLAPWFEELAAFRKSLAFKEMHAAILAADSSVTSTSSDHSEHIQAASVPDTAIHLEQSATTDPSVVSDVLKDDVQAGITIELHASEQAAQASSSIQEPDSETICESSETEAEHSQIADTIHADASHNEQSDESEHGLSSSTVSATEASNASGKPDITSVTDRLPVMHIPLDGLAREWRRPGCYTLGFAVAGPQEKSTELSDLVVASLATRFQTKLNRKTLLICIRDEAQTDISVCEWFHNVSYDICQWGPTPEPSDRSPKSPANRRWLDQLSALSTLKKQYGLILIAFGSIDALSTKRLGKLCDGVTVFVSPSAEPRSLVQQLKSCQRDEVRIVGVWSLQEPVKNRAA